MVLYLVVQIPMQKVAPVATSAVVLGYVYGWVFGFLRLRFVLVRASVGACVWRTRI